jgi:hypothetical protein
MKKALLVAASFLTRVVVDENATEQEIMEKAALNISEKATTEFSDNLEYIELDTECPYDPAFDD